MIVLIVYKHGIDGNILICIARLNHWAGYATKQHQIYVETFEENFGKNKQGLPYVGTLVQYTWKKLCFVMTMFCSACECTVCYRQ